tara:strand:- start:43829 stop:44497 length:669 start_codon:yes stop_codon:yes gene_type:complete
MSTLTDPALLRLLQLSSAALPVGGYAFSQGLESAVAECWVDDAAATREWLCAQLHESVARIDLPLLERQMRAMAIGDTRALDEWNAYLLAARETAELRLTETAMGAALRRLLRQLDVSVPELDEPGFVSVFAVAAVHWCVPPRSACLGYAWSWLENQVAAATKLVPLGQSQAQILLGELIGQMPAALDRAGATADEDIGASLPGLALASTWHEVQYTRLFRS